MPGPCISWPTCTTCPLSMVRKLRACGSLIWVDSVISGCTELMRQMGGKLSNASLQKLRQQHWHAGRWLT